MNGYLARLMRQSAVKISGGDPDSRALPPTPAGDAVTGPADVSEEETTREVPLSEAPTPAPGARDGQSMMSASSPPDEAPAEHESYAEARPRAESLQEAQPIEPKARPTAGAIPFVSIGPTNPSPTPNERPPAMTVPSSSEEFPAAVEMRSSTPEAQEIVREVVAWVTDTKSPAASARIESTKHAARTSAVVERNPIRDSHRPHEHSVEHVFPTVVESRASGLPDRDSLPSVEEAHLIAPPAAKAESWSVQIDSIHLTIEEPAAKPAPAPVGPPVAPPAVSAPAQFTPSRLRRHYLRPF